MRWGFRLLLLVCAVVVVGPLSSVSVARAVNISASQSLSEDVVEIGDPVTVTLELSLDEDIPPGSPELAVPPGFSTSRVNTSTMKIQINRSFRRDYTARWVIVPEKMGSFEIGPPSVDVGGTRVKAPGSLTLKVVGKGQGPPKRGQARRRNRIGGFDTFFAPKAPFDLDDPFFQFAEPRKSFDSGRDLKLARALDSGAFIYIHADKTRAVVGEQITISYWVYFNVDFVDLDDYKEPPLSAFTREVLSVPAATRGRVIRTTVGGRLHGAKQYGEVAIFPVRPGKLSTGSWTANIEVLRAAGRRSLPRKSNEVIIDVREAPAAGRPLGYKAGTVGRFKMKADVAPRETFVGDTTSVSVQVTGVGRLPSELRLPARMGIEWLKPERKDGVSMVHGNVGGWRTFDYAVRFTQAGDVDLGSVELPYWDPDKGKYEVATAELGAVKVKENPDAPATAEPTPSAEGDKPDPFAGIAAPRPSLRPFVVEQDQGVAPSTLWTWVLVPPIGVAFTSLAAAYLRRARRRRGEKKHDPAVRAKGALSDMAAAADAKDAAAAAERALHLAIEAKTGLKSRGMLKDDLAEKLGAALADEALTRSVLDLFEAASAIRFEPTSDDEVGARICAEAADVVKALLKP